jgi:glycosyltransferase involved in cell wall biosynthesis
MTPTASVVIPCFNAAETLSAQLAQLLPQVERNRAELILVDNNSTDATAHILAEVKNHPNVIVTSATTSQGASYARNTGASIARSDRFLFCDADDVVASDWLRVLSSSLDNHDVVTGSLETRALNSARLAESRGQSDAPASFYGLFPIAHGGNMGVTRRAWDEIGPLDESLEAFEDMEWSLRARVAGHPIARETRAVVSYRYRSTARELWHQGFTYGVQRPLLARTTFEKLGIRPGRFTGARSWAWLTLHLGGVATTRGRARLAWVAGNRWGNLVGSARARFLVL